MKRTYLIIAMLTLIVSYASAQFTWPFDKETRHVTKEDALNFIKAKYAGKDVDYYGSIDYLNTNDSKSAVATQSNDVDPGFNPFDPEFKVNWIILVDEEPQKGWEHNCTVYYVPKTITVDKDAPAGSGIAIAKTEHRTNPSFYSAMLVPWEVKNRYGSNAALKLRVPVSTQTNSASEAAKHTYAIILSGGISPLNNHHRYWNDCSYIYQTLTNKYGVPKSNIVPIMGDGNAPSFDSYDPTTGDPISSSLDLDFDGIDELEYPAYKSVVIEEFAKMANKLTHEDHFFLFVIDHGGTDDRNTQSYICLWNNESLYDTELATLLDQINARSINVVLGQCFAGGFIDNLQKPGRVIATACKGNESSWSCGDIPYDEFVFHWTNTINERNITTGTSVTSDVNKSGTVTMDEAFDYAQANDRRSETPMYSSMPRSVGEDLAFNNIPLDIDLYMRDNYEDTGKEPNTTTTKFWASPDVWVRNTDDGLTHQESEALKVNEVDQNIYVYFRITNRGTKDYNGDGKYLHAYWANTAFGQTADAWLGIANKEDGKPFGGELFDPLPIDVPIKAGESVIVAKKDVIPRTIATQCLKTGNDAHICILARIKENFGDPTQSDDSLKIMIGRKAESKKLVQKNLTVIDSEDLSTNNVPILMRGMTTQPAKYGLKVLSDSRSTSNVFNRVEIALNLSTPILNAWKNGGKKAVNVSVSPTTPQIIRLMNVGSQITNMTLTDSQIGDVNFTCRLLANTEITKHDTLRFHIAQTDENGDYVGGEEFEVRIAPRPAMVPKANSSVVDGQYVLTASNVNEPVSYEWYDINENLVGKGQNIKMPIEKYGQYKLRVIADKDGAVSYANINVASVMNIEAAAFTQTTGGDVNIKLSMPATDKTKVKITSVANPMYTREIKVRERETQVQADVTGCPKGVYMVSLEENGVTMDTKRIINE